MTLANKLTDRHTIASYFARVHLRNAVYLGGNEQEVIEKAGLTTELLKQPKSRVLPSQLASIVRACWQLGDDELLGLTQQKVKVGMFALLGERLISCKNLAEVIAQMAAFYNLTGDQIHFKIEYQGSLVHFSVNANFKPKSSNPTPSNLLTELLLLISHRFPCWLLGQVIPLTQVHVRHSKPDHHDEYRLMYACPCVFESQDNTLVFDAKYLSLPVTRHANELEQYLGETPLHWFKKQSYYDTFSAQVMRILEDSDFEKESSVEKIATRLNMTSRTLRRKLTSEGSRFQQLKDNARRDQAINLFENASLTIAEIGQRVGFTEPATFTRAFKQWTGVSPSTYRNYSSALEIPQVHK
jgi:AraC-like DNA-binding protein